MFSRSSSRRLGSSKFLFHPLPMPPPPACRFSSLLNEYPQRRFVPVFSSNVCNFSATCPCTRWEYWCWDAWCRGRKRSRRRRQEAPAYPHWRPWRPDGGADWHRACALLGPARPRMDAGGTCRWCAWRRPKTTRAVARPCPRSRASSSMETNWKLQRPSPRARSAGAFEKTSVSCSHNTGLLQQLPGVWVLGFRV